MSTKTPSRTSPRTLADVIAAVQDRDDLPLKQRHDLSSAVRAIAKLLGAGPEAVAADIEQIRRSLRPLTAASAGVTRATWRNRQSLFFKALRLTGVTASSRRLHEPMAQAWQDLLQLVRDPYERTKLTRLARFCTARSEAPGDVDDDVLDAFGSMLQQSFVDRPKQVHRNAAVAWNRCADAVPGWPTARLTVPDNRRVYALPLSAFPASFQADVAAYLDQLAGKDLFSQTAPKPASPTTLLTRRIQLLELATALVNTGRPLASITSLADLVEVEAAKAALTFLWQHNGQRKTGQLHNFARLLTTVARSWVAVPDVQLGQLRALRKQINPGKTGLTERNKARLRQFANAETVARLVNLPDEVLKLTLRSPRPSYNDAVLVQSAIAIAIELAAPLRPKNLASLTLDRHIVRTHANGGTLAHVVVPGAEVKNGTDLEFVLPASVVRLIDAYCARFRPLLATEASTWLFPARKGGPRDPGPFAVQIKKALKQQLGLDLNLHAFRHLSAYLYLKAHPGEYETIRLLLGHKDIRTTVQFYCGLEQHDAFQRYDALIESYRLTNRGSAGTANLAQNGASKIGG